jgi:hypothetical protein
MFRVSKYHEHVKTLFAVDYIHHGFLSRSALPCNRSLQLRSTSGERPCEATFSEEIAPIQNAYRGFLPALRHNREFYFSFLNIKTASDESH